MICDQLEEYHVLQSKGKCGVNEHYCLHFFYTCGLERAEGLCYTL